MPRSVQTTRTTGIASSAMDRPRLTNSAALPPAQGPRLQTSLRSSSESVAPSDSSLLMMETAGMARGRGWNRSNSTVVSDGQKIAVLQEKIKALTQENKALTQESLNKDHAIDEHLARIAELEEDNSTKENLINGYRARIAELENAPEFQRPPPTLRGNVENDAHVQASRDRYERTLRDGAEDDDDVDENASLGSDDNDDDGSFASIRRNFDENVALLLRESREDFQSLKQKYFAGGPPAPPRRDLGGPTEQSGNNSAARNNNNDDGSE